MMLSYLKIFHEEMLLVDSVVRDNQIVKKLVKGTGALKKSQKVDLDVVLFSIIA